MSCPTIPGRSETTSSKRLTLKKKEKDDSSYKSPHIIRSWQLTAQAVVGSLLPD